MRKSVSIALSLLALVLCSPGGAAPSSALVPAPTQEAPLIPVFFTVTDQEGDFVLDLGPDDFSVEESGEVREIRAFSPPDGVGFKLALLLDMSVSNIRKLAPSIRAAQDFLRSVLGPRDQALVAGFNTEVGVIQELTQSPDLLSRALDGLRGGGQTALYDAVYQFSLGRFASEAGRKVVLLLGDGDDTASRMRSTEALRAAQLANVQIYSIVLEDPEPTTLLRPRNTDMRDVRELAEGTGGIVLGPLLPEDAEAAFDRIALELKSQYGLAFAVGAASGANYREIRIRTARDDLDVRAREGYYLPEPLEEP